MARVLFAITFAALMAACQSPSAPVAPQIGPDALPAPAPPSSPPLPSSPMSARFRVSGVVTDENGSPLAGKTVEVDYAPASPVFSIPPSFCPFAFGCWFVTKTDAAGRYDVVYDATRTSSGAAPGTAGFITAFGGGTHEINTQIVAFERTEQVQNFRLRPVRVIGVGGGAIVTVEPDSSLCTDLEDLFAFSYRCETVTVSVGAAGVLVVEARGQGGVEPRMFWATTGNYRDIVTRIGPGAVSVPVTAGSFQMLVGIPVGMPAQRVDVTTSLR